MMYINGGGITNTGCRTVLRRDAEALALCAGFADRGGPIERGGCIYSSWVMNGQICFCKRAAAGAGANSGVLIRHDAEVNLWAERSGRVFDKELNSRRWEQTR